MDLVADIAAVLGLVLLIGAVLGLFFKAFLWTDKSLEGKIVQTIQEATSQIKIGADGGQSLNDVGKAVKALADYQHRETVKRDETLKTLVDQQAKIHEQNQEEHETLRDMINESHEAIEKIGKVIDRRRESHVESEFLDQDSGTSN